MAGYARKSQTRNQRRRKVVEQKLMGIGTHRNLRPDIMACVHRSYTGGQRLYGGSSHRTNRLYMLFSKQTIIP